MRLCGQRTEAETMTPTEKRLAKIVELGEAVLFEHAETAGSMTDEQMRDARQRLRSIGREVSRLSEKFKAAYKSSVPWEVMSEWADRHRFEEASFDLEALIGCCWTLEVALPELSRHSGGQTSIQEKVSGDLDLMSSEKASDLDRYRQASLIHIAVTILLLSVRAMLVEAGWSYTFTEIAAYCLLLIPLWRVMRTNEDLSGTAKAIPTDADSFFTYTQFYDISLREKQANLLKLAREVLLKAERHRKTILAWRAGWVISIATTIAARIWTVY